MTVAPSVMSDEFLSRLSGMGPTDSIDVIVAAKLPQGLEEDVGRTPKIRMSLPERQAALNANERALRPVTDYLKEIGASYSTYAPLRRVRTILTVEQVMVLSQQPYVASIIGNQEVTLV
ncbi:hypothetical protein HYY74_03610 [Candidatus Woesearchaeota archaeon]|nr:hypothetical protein [Candidatus Woesearchaeota archaeon]